MFYPLPSLGLSKKIQVVTPERSCRPACRSGTQAGSPVLRLFQISGFPAPACGVLILRGGQATEWARAITSVVRAGR
jgi:hypothetical protein